MIFTYAKSWFLVNAKITSVGKTLAKRFGKILAGGTNFGKIGGDQLQHGGKLWDNLDGRGGGKLWLGWTSFRSKMAEILREGTNFGKIISRLLSDCFNLWEISSFLI
jgi:hypothetical protein